MRKHRDIIDNADALVQARHKAFQALADAQRGDPEIAMLGVQHAMGGGVLNYCVEHVGDLTHRMADAIEFIPHFGYSMVLPKVERCLRMLSSRYISRRFPDETGFYAEHMENVRNNANYYGMTPDQFEEKIRPFLKKYAEEHAKLFVYNDAQYWAREAAIALGEQKFGEARRNLEFLMSHLNTPEEWSAYAGQFNPNFNQRRMTARPPLTEAPIVHTELRGPDSYDVRSGTGKPQSFDKGTGFGKVDQDILTSKKGMAKIVRAFKNTPHNFEVFFINNDRVHGDDETDNADVDGQARIHKAGVMRASGNIEGKPGVIRVVLLSNLSPFDQGKMPMTGWTLAHKIGHSLQDECYNSGWQTPWSEPVKRILNWLNQIAAKDTGEPYVGTGAWFHMHQHIHDKLTMKSARTGKLTNDFEVFAEVIAQYLVSGKVTMHVGPECAADLAALNAEIAQLFEELEGSVLLEV